MTSKIKAMFNGPCHKKAVLHVVFHAAIALIPLTAVVVMFLYGQWNGMFFMENGEFYIYSVVFFTMALYALVSLGLKKDNWGMLLIVMTIILLIFALVLYGSLIHGKIVTPDFMPPIPESLQLSSWILLMVSLIIFYVSTYWEIYREHVATTRSDDRDGIEELKETLS